MLAFDMLTLTYVYVRWVGIPTLTVPSGNANPDGTIPNIIFDHIPVLVV
jgi:hypothetical protein